MAPFLSDPVRRPTRRGAVSARILLATMLVAALGCDISIPADPGGAGDNVNDNSGAPQPTPDPLVMVRLVNATESAVDAMLFVSSNALDDPASEFFTEEHRFSDAIGLAATGLLVPLASDSAVIPCADGLILGTSGGVFLDAEDGEELGTGTPRILQQGFVFDCGDIVTLVYFFRDGEYGVDVGLQ